jgi:hypothetical protein
MDGTKTSPVPNLLNSRTAEHWHKCQPGVQLNAAEADRADELLEQFNHFRLAGNFSDRPS